MTMLQDLRYCFRLIYKSRLNSTFIVFVLAVGIGLNIIVFGLIDVLLLRRLPVRAPDELVRLVQVFPNLGARSIYTYRSYEVLKESSKSFAEVIAYSALSTSERDDFGATSRIWCELVSDNYFSALGVRPLLGRLLGTGSSSLSLNASEVVLSHPYWKRRFGGDPGAIGRSLRLRDHVFTIVGVTPVEFNGIQIDTTPDVRIPLGAADLVATQPELNSYRKLRYNVVGRRRPGISLAQARAEAESLFRAAVAEQFPNDAAWQNLLRQPFDAQPITNGLSQLREKYSPVLFLLSALVALLLLMICANVGGLLLARAVARRHEAAVRLALGATIGRLVRLWLTESFVLTAAGGLAGLGLAWTSMPMLRHVLPPLRHPDTTQMIISLDLRPDLRVIAFSIALCSICALVAGFPVATQALRSDLYSVLRATRSSTRDGLRWGLAATQAGLATVLIGLCGLLVSTLHNLRSLDAGFDRDRIATFTADPGMLNYTPVQAQNLEARLLDIVKEAPGVDSAALASVGLMLGSGLKTTVAPAGQKVVPGDYMNTSIHVVSPEYFETMGIRLTGGRNFRADESGGKPEPVLVNHAFIKRFYPSLEPIGQKFGFPLDQPAGPDYEIIGTLTDAKYRSLREPVPPTIYRLWSLITTRAFVLHVRTRLPPQELIEPVRSVLRALDPRLPFNDVRTLAAEVDSSLWAERMLAWVSIIFSSLAAAIAMLGVYATLAYAVAQRRREFGILAALGARPQDILLACTLRPLAILGVGTAIGTTGLYLATPLLGAVLYGISPRDPSAIFIALILMFLLALATTSLTAKKVLGVDPARALREE